jgi:hypothetical protein
MTGGAHGGPWRYDGPLRFWVLVCALIFAKIVLVADLSVQINYSPHDDSLYIERAFHLLAGDAFGPYDSKTLLKYPGLTLWLAAMRAMHIPFLVSINVVYFAAGLYMITALLRAGVARAVMLAAFALYAFNPITLGYEWIRVIREPLSTGLFVAMWAAMLHMVVSAEAGRRAWGHLAVFSALFAFSLFLREDDRLLWGLLALFAAAWAWRAYRSPHRRTALAWVLVVVAVPTVVAKGYEHAQRSFVERSYGLPILHEMSEGEYPKLLAAIRSIDSAKKNRMVMVTQEALAKMRREIPGLRPVIDRLPPTGPDTFSCRIHGVCSEWSNGWMPFWIRDQAYEAGLMPNLPAAQDYFRRMRGEIEAACRAGKFSCTPKGQGTMPPMELVWTRALVAEAWRLVKMGLSPDPHAVGAPPQVYLSPPEVIRMFQAVTLTRFTGLDWNPLDDRNASLESGRGTVRTVLAGVLRLGGIFVLLAGIAALAVRLWISDRRPLGPLAMVGTVFALYCGLRLAALSYVAVFLGAFDPRMMFSLYTAGMLFALPLIADAVGTWASLREKS